MRAVSFDGVDFLLLDEEPNWESPVEATISVIRDDTAGLTNRESRQKWSSTIRWDLRYIVTLDGSARMAFRKGLRATGDQWFGVPLWPAECSPASFPPLFPASKYVTITGTTATVFSGALPSGIASSARIFPLLLGRIDQRKIGLLTPDIGDVEIQFREESSVSWAVGIAAASFVTGPIPGPGYSDAPVLWERDAEWGNPNTRYTVRVIQEEIGFGRAPARTIYPQDAAGEWDLEHTLEGQTDIARALAFITSHWGGKSFWVPWPEIAAIPLAPVPSASATITASHSFTAGSFAVFSDPASTVTRRVLSTTSTTFTLDSPVGPYDLDYLAIRELKLARLRTNSFRIIWVEPQLASISLPVREVPAEITIPSDETLGATIGEIEGVEAYLYLFQKVLDGGSILHGYTSHESDLEGPGPTFFSARIEHGSIQESLYLESNEVDLTLEVRAGNPLVDSVAFRSEGPIHLYIYRGAIVGNLVPDAVNIFTGQIVEHSLRGSVIHARAVVGGRSLDRRAPAWIVQRRCNVHVFSPACGLDRDDWKFTATVASGVAPGWPYQLPITGLARVTGSMPSIGADWFAGEWVEIGGLTRLPILRSTAPASGALTLTLDRDPAPFPSVGTSVTLYPGCDGLWDTCRNKFANGNRFRGHPFVPAANPSLIKISSAIGGGKK